MVSAVWEYLPSVNVGNAVPGVPTAARRQFGTACGLMPDGTLGTAFSTLDMCEYGRKGNRERFPFV